MIRSQASNELTDLSLRRVSDQSARSLLEFYRRLTTRKPDSSLADTGRRMLELLPPLAARLAGLEIWGLTSHAELWLLPRNDYRAPWLVGIAGVFDGYRIRYRLPAGEAPWPNAHVEGIATDVDGALAMIAIAIDRCGGWPAPLAAPIGPI